MSTGAIESHYATSGKLEASKNIRFPRRGIVLWGVFLLSLALIKGLDLLFIELNERKIILPNFNVRLIPYHDPRVTNRVASLAQYERQPRIIFTGDSRTKNGFNPEVIAKELGVPVETFFNFGTGSQGITFAREAFLPHLTENGIRPVYLVFGITPDWLLDRESIRRIVDRYKNSWAYRMSHPEQTDGDHLETRISFFLARHFALYRYRTDLFTQEIVPLFECSVLRKCFASLYGSKMPLRDIRIWESRQTKYGWNPQPWDGKTRGDFRGRPRFGPTSEFDGPTSEFDQEKLVGLIQKVRAVGVTPVFVLMPLHPTFWEAHKESMPAILAGLQEVALRERVDLIVPAGDYSDPKLFVDGHHLSNRGAEYFSRDVAPQLRPYLEDRFGDR